MINYDIKQAAKFAMYNKENVLAAKICGCYHCMAIFEPKEIKEWTDKNQTALCPFCNVDAILPNLNKDTLHKLNTYWFGGD
jgi:hypothetical protein